jgi:hypothetical protein
LLSSIRLKLNERTIVFKHGVPLRAYGPGKSWLFGRGLTEQRFNTDKLVFTAQPELRAKLPKDWFHEVTIGRLERGILWRDGVPVAFLRPGVARYWKVDPSVRLEVYDVREPLPPVTKELEALIPRDEFIDVTVQAYERGLRFEQGRLTAVLEPGRYRLWTYPDAEIRIGRVDMRRTDVTIPGQDLMTRDKASLRLTLTVEYAVEDPALATERLPNVRDFVYLTAQLAARTYVSRVTLDELLEGRDAFTDYLEEDMAPKAKALGVRIERVGVKDVTLPGEVKAAFNRVIEAEKEAAANAILRGEETTLTRPLSNIARVMPISSSCSACGSWAR